MPGAYDRGRRERGPRLFSLGRAEGQREAGPAGAARPDDGGGCTAESLRCRSRLSRRVFSDSPVMTVVKCAPRRRPGPVELGVSPAGRQLAVLISAPFTARQGPRARGRCVPNSDGEGWRGEAGGDASAVIRSLLQGAVNSRGVSLQHCRLEGRFRTG